MVENIFLNVYFYCWLLLSSKLLDGAMTLPPARTSPGTDATRRGTPGTGWTAAAAEGGGTTWGTLTETASGAGGTFPRSTDRETTFFFVFLILLETGMALGNLSCICYCK